MTRTRKLARRTKNVGQSAYQILIAVALILAIIVLWRMLGK